MSMPFSFPPSLLQTLVKFGILPSSALEPSPPTEFATSSSEIASTSHSVPQPRPWLGSEDGNHAVDNPTTTINGVERPTFGPQPRPWFGSEDGNHAVDNPTTTINGVERPTFGPQPRPWFGSEDGGHAIDNPTTTINGVERPTFGPQPRPWLPIEQSTTGEHEPETGGACLNVEAPIAYVEPLEEPPIFSVCYVEAPIIAPVVWVEPAFSASNDLL